MELENQISLVRNQMLLDGYSHSGINCYNYSWNRLKELAKVYDHSAYSDELGTSFIKTMQLEDDDYDINENRYKRSIELIRFFLAEGKIASPALRSKKLSFNFQKILDDYITWLLNQDQSKSSIKTKKSRTRIFLTYLEGQQLYDIESLTTDILLKFMDYLTGRYTSSYSKGGILYTLRDFLNYCVLQFNIDSKLSSLIKNIHTNPNESLPSVYTPDEIQRILSSVNRSTTIGKQTYAMIVLFSILGLRSSDVANLKISSIHWNKFTLEFYQHKTGIFCQLHMTRNVQVALMEHIKANRLQATQNENVFLRTRSPILPFNGTSGIYHIISNCIKQSGIDIKGRSVGPHALRHSMASRLLTNKVELPVIAAALGHTSTKNTSRYLRIDTEELRSVALEVPL